MKKAILLFASVLLISSSFAQGVLGDWYGSLSVPGAGVLPLVFHIKKSGDVYSTLMDSPAQGAMGFATGVTTIAGNQINIDASAKGITYTGIYLPDSNKITGIFKQGGGRLPLTFSRTEAKVASAPIVRPQDPKNFPYKREDVAFDNPKGGDRLAGTLTMPTDGKASKIVVLITGSGPQNRDEELFNHRPFLVWSDWLTRHGIGVLRYDDRGVAKSTGDYYTATSADFADNAEAAVSYIQSRADLKNLSIGLIGHSEGGLIAPMVASRNKAVKFMVLLAGQGVPSTQLMIKQTEDQLRGISPEAAQFNLGLNKKIYALAVQNQSSPTAQFQQEVDTLIRNYVHNPAAGAQVDELVKTYQQQLTPWMRYFLAVDPAVYLIKVKCPVLALDGTLDMQVNAEANLAGIKTSLEKAGNKHFEVVTLDGLNHLFQKATNGSVAEYEQIPETVDPVALEKVTAWINKL